MVEIVNCIMYNTNKENKNNKNEREYGMLNASCIYVEQKLLENNIDYFYELASRSTILSYGENKDANFVSFIHDGSDEFSALVCEVALRKLAKRQVLIIHSNSFFLNKAYEEGFQCVGIGGPYDQIRHTYPNIDTLFVNFNKKTKRKGFFFAISVIGLFISLTSIIMYPEIEIFVIGGVVGFFIFFCASIFFYPNKRFWSIVEFIADVFTG